MRFLIRVIDVPAFTSFQRATSRASRKTVLSLFAVAVLLAGTTATRGQLALDSSDPTPTPTPPAQAINLSTRMLVQSGDNVGIGGFIITGNAPKPVLLRALGPSLSQIGVPSVLANPVLELHGPGTFVTITNDNWKDTQRSAIEGTGIPPGNDLESAIVATLDHGAYTAIVKSQDGTSGIALFEVYDLNPSADSKLANISTRAVVSPGDNVLIGGFILGGSNGDTNSVVVRGIGPSLTARGVPGALADPYLVLRDSNGTIIAENDNWHDNPPQDVKVMGAGLSPGDPSESAIATILPPGFYTAVLTGVNNTSGVGLVEVYDLQSPDSFPAAASTVTRFQTGTVNSVEAQNVVLNPDRIANTFRIVFNQPYTINHSAIGSRAALQAVTAPISFNATAGDIQTAIQAVRGYYAYSQLGNTNAVNQLLSYFPNLGATNREPIVTGNPSDGFTIQFGSPVGSPTLYNTWVTGLPLVTIVAP
jgi:hypothetical protein